MVNLVFIPDGSAILKHLNPQNAIATTSTRLFSYAILHYQGDISVGLLQRILRQAGISCEKWLEE